MQWDESNQMNNILLPLLLLLLVISEQHSAVVNAQCADVVDEWAWEMMKILLYLN